MVCRLFWSPDWTLCCKANWRSDCACCSSISAAESRSLATCLFDDFIEAVELTESLCCRIDVPWSAKKFQSGYVSGETEDELR